MRIYPFIEYYYLPHLFGGGAKEQRSEAVTAVSPSLGVSYSAETTFIPINELGRTAFPAGADPLVHPPGVPGRCTLE